MFFLYRAQGKNGISYYGYCNTENLAFEFRRHAIKTTEKFRCSNILWKQNGETLDSFSFELIETFECEFDAWAARNDMRASSGDSISRPTFLPGIFARKTSNEKLFAWKKSIDISSAKTAREAWALGKWTKDQILSLLNSHKKNTIVFDLDKLCPASFQEKYLNVR